MENQSKQKGPMAVARKPWKVAAGHFLLLCAVSVISAVLIGGAGSQFVTDVFGADRVSMSQSISELGETVRSELGSGLAIAASIQFGVLIALVGRQIDAGSTKDEMSLREALTYLAVLPIVLLSPAVLLATAGVLMDGGAGLGELLVLLPVFAVQIGMAIVIMTFELADSETLAERSRDWADQAANDLRAMHRRPATSRRRFAFWVSGVAGAIAAVAVAPLALWRPQWSEAVLQIVFLAVLIAVTFAGFLFMVAAENAALKPRKVAPTVLPIRMLYIALTLTMAVIGLYGLLLYPPLGVSAFLALGAAVHCIRSSWREAETVRERSEFDGYEWWRGGMVTRFGNRWAAAEALLSLRAARASIERYRSQTESSRATACTGRGATGPAGTPHSRSQALS